ERHPTLHDLQEDVARLEFSEGGIPAFHPRSQPFPGASPQETRTDRVDTNVMWRVVKGQTLRQGDHTRLRCGVRRQAWRRHEAGDRCDVDDSAAATSFQVRRGGFRRYERRAEVLCELLIPYGGRHVVHASTLRPHRTRIEGAAPRAGIVHDNVESTVRLD